MARPIKPTRLQAQALSAQRVGISRREAARRRGVTDNAERNLLSRARRRRGLTHPPAAPPTDAAERPPRVIRPMQLSAVPFAA